MLTAVAKRKLRTRGEYASTRLDTQAKEPPDPTNPLLTLPQVTLTPYSAGSTVDCYHKRFSNGYANIERVARGQPPLWVIPEMRDLFPAATAIE
jgi:phosphoglycerate dehydrogenase-like enzyme